MTYLADALIRSSVLLLAGLAAVVLLGRCSAALRHWLLAATITAAALAAPLAWILPEWPVAAVRTPAVLASTLRPAPVSGNGGDTRSDGHVPTTAAVRVAAAPAAAARQLPFGLVWAVGFAIGIGALLAQLARLARTSRRAVLRPPVA